MLRLLFILMLLILSAPSFAQIDECQLGRDSAQVDYQNGILRTYIFGLTNSYTLGRLLKENYGIDAVYMGCIVDTMWDCYAVYMDEKIKETFGDDVFERTLEQSRLLDSMGKGDRDSAFPGGEFVMMQFVYCNLDLSTAGLTEHEQHQVVLKFTIDTTGRPVDIKVMKSPNEACSSEAIRVVQLMPYWTTATRNGCAIEQPWYLPIVFDSERKTRHCP